MWHHLQIQLDDIALNVDDKWPPAFLASHGDNFKCEIDIQYTVEDGIEEIGTPVGTHRKSYIDVVKVDSVEIRVNGLRPDYKIHRRLESAVRLMLDRDPKVLIRNAERCLNKN